MSKQIKVKNIKPQTIKVKNTNPHIVVTIPDPDVYDEGFEAGKEALNNEVNTELQVIIDKEDELINSTGVVPYYDRFWDSIQDYGNRTDYQYFFAGASWNDITFKPKYDIILRGSTPTYSVFIKSKITNLKKILEDCGVVLSTVGITYNTSLFNESSITDLPEMNLSNANNLSTFNGAMSLKSVDKFIVGDMEHTYNNTFNSCKSLVHCPIEGVIRNTGLNMKDCVLLNKESIISVVNCLSATTSGLAVTISLQAVNKAFETNENANDGSNSNEWQNLINTKQNWTINLS